MWLLGNISFALIFSKVNWSSVTDFIVFFIGLFGQTYVDSIFDLAAQNPNDFAIYDIFIVILIIVIVGVPMLTAVMAEIRDIVVNKTSSAKIVRNVRVRFVLGSLLFLCIVWLSIINARIGTAMRINSIFQRQLMAFTPVISEQNRNEILGEWAMMKSKSDYSKVNDEMKMLAEKYHIHLPGSAW